VQKLNESNILVKLRKQTIKSVMDIIMLSELKKGPMSGYDAIGFIHDKFGVLLSSGTVYAHLYALERDNLIAGTNDTKKRIYELTEKGKQAVENISQENAEILGTLRKVLKS